MSRRRLSSPPAPPVSKSDESCGSCDDCPLSTTSLITQSQLAPGPLCERAVLDHAALAAALDPIITIDAHGVVQSASDSVERVLGWTASELTGQSINIFMPEPHHSTHNGYLAEYIRTGRATVLNRPRRVQALRRDGSLIDIELCVSKADIAGGLPLFVGIIRDVSAYVAVERSHDEERLRSQRHIAEQTSALQQANLRLRMADRMASIGTLAAGLGHDMNNVLLPVRARLDALSAAVQSSKLPASEHKHIAEVRKSIAYLQQLADGLHFLAMDPETPEDIRGGGSTTDLHQWWIDTGALLSKAVPKHVRVIATIPAGLPRCAIAAHGLTQAMLNLIVNAGEAIPGPDKRKRCQGYVRITAKVARTGAGDWIKVSVTDNGTGMSEDVKRRAFEMFYTTKPRGLGTGLGMPLVRTVVEHAGGHVDIESEVGKGSTITMRLPAAQSTRTSRTTATTLAAVITVNDGRAAAVIRHLLTCSGVPVLEGGAPEQAHIWVTDGSARMPAMKLWRAKHPHGKLVIFGNSAPAFAAELKQLSPITIENINDFEAIRAAIDSVFNA